jgi:hypothetical protein
MIFVAKERCAKLVAKFQGKKISELAILRQWVQACHLMHCSHNEGWTWYIRVICKSHPLFHPYLLCFGPPIPLFQWWYPQSKEILLNLGMKCWNSAFNAQCWRVIIVVVQVGAVKIYVAAVQVLRKKGNIGWNSFYHQNWWEKLVWVPVISLCQNFHFQLHVWCPIMLKQFYHQNWWKKLVWVPVISLCKNFHFQLHVWCPIMLKQAVLAPPNRLTLEITLWHGFIKEVLLT